jgi:HlyD family secretion protein
MSVTTTPSPVVPPPGRAGGLLSRLRGTSDSLPIETLEFFSPSQALLARRPLRLADNVVAIIGTMFLTIFLLFFLLNLDRIAEGQGKVISMVPETVVQPLNTGVVKTIAVNAGDVVRKGQLLAQLDPTFASADNTMAVEQLDRYQTEVDRLTAEFHQVPYRPRQLTAGALVQEGIYSQRSAAREAELRYYKGQVDAQRALQAQAQAQISQYAKETGVATDVERIYTQEEKDAVGSHINTLTSVNTRLEAERNVLFNVHQEENARQTIAALQGQLDNYNQQWFADVSQTITDDEVQLAQYRDQMEHAALNYKLVDLRAQEDSIVLSVAPVSPGSVMQAGQTFFTLVPINAPLEIDAQLTADQSGFAAVGQTADIKFETFPFMSYGEAEGSVRLLSPDSFTTGGGAAGSSSASGMPSGTTGNSIFTGANPTSPYFYDVRVSIDQVHLKNLPRDFHITPGMPVEVDIKVGNRTIWDYLIERFLPIVYEGMREPN